MDAQIPGALHRKLLLNMLPYVFLHEDCFLRKPGSAISDIISSVISSVISYLITVYRDILATLNYGGDFVRNYIQNHLRSTTSEVITYQTSYKITDELMSEMALPGFRSFYLWWHIIVMIACCDLAETTLQ